MKASRIIKLLEAAIEEHGDLEFFSFDSEGELFLKETVEKVDAHAEPNAPYDHFVFVEAP